MTALLFALHLLALAGLPFLLTGVIQRTKARWAGRRGPRLMQSLSDAARLLRKQPVYGEVTTPVFRLGPLVALATTLASGAFVPVLRDFAPLALPYDFVAVAYLWSLGRMAQVLGALDTASAFEGMGASREALFGALVEPALFLSLGTLAMASGGSAFAELIHVGFDTPAHVLVSLGCTAALFGVLQVEAARVPVDDPATHLELTMIHEVMVLDHSGPELAALQVTAGLKLTLAAALVASLVNPVPASAGPLVAAGANVLLTLAVGVALGLVESLVARLRMATVPRFITASIVGAVVALLGALWGSGRVP